MARARCGRGVGRLLRRRKSAFPIEGESADREECPGKVRARLVLRAGTHLREKDPGPRAGAGQEIVAGAADGFKALRSPERLRARPPSAPLPAGRSMRAAAWPGSSAWRRRPGARQSFGWASDWSCAWPAGRREPRGARAGSLAQIWLDRRAKDRPPPAIHERPPVLGGFCHQFLRAPRQHRRGHPAGALDVLEERPRLAPELIGEGLDIPRAARRIDLVRECAFLRKDVVQVVAPCAARVRTGRRRPRRTAGSQSRPPRQGQPPAPGW